MHVTDDYVYLQQQANETTIKHLDLAKYRIVAFATHGLIAGDLDGLEQPALAQARRYLIEQGGYHQNGNLIYSYAHPLFWSAFIVVGEGNQ